MFLWLWTIEDKRTEASYIVIKSCLAPWITFFFNSYSFKCSKGRFAAASSFLISSTWFKNCACRGSHILASCSCFLSDCMAYSVMVSIRLDSNMKAIELSEIRVGPSSPSLAASNSSYETPCGVKPEHYQALIDRTTNNPRITKHTTLIRCTSRLKFRWPSRIFSIYHALNSIWAKSSM